MIDLSKLNPIAKIAIECFQDAGFDEPYIYGKVEQLKRQDKWQTVFWATHQLDSKNKARFANKIGVPVDDLVTTFEVIRKIEFHN